MRIAQAFINRSPIDPNQGFISSVVVDTIKSVNLNQELSMIMDEDPETELPQSLMVISSQIVPPTFSDEEQLRAEGVHNLSDSVKSLLRK